MVRSVSDRPHRSQMFENCRFRLGRHRCIDQTAWMRNAVCGVIAAVFGCLSGGATADDAGFYVGGSIGTTNYSDQDPEDIEVLGIDVELEADNGVPLGLSALAGYRLNDSFRFELEYKQESIETDVSANVLNLINIDGINADTETDRVTLNAFWDFWRSDLNLHFFSAENVSFFSGFGVGAGTVENAAANLAAFGSTESDPEIIPTFNIDLGASFPLGEGFEFSPSLRYTYWHTGGDDAAAAVFGESFHGLGVQATVRFNLF